MRQREAIVGTWRAMQADVPDITEAETRMALESVDPMWGRAVIATTVVVRVPLAIKKWGEWSNLIYTNGSMLKAPAGTKKMDRTCAGNTLWLARV
ncbi:MAG: hypothetical protein NT133_05675 [Alphaproteobacteria bacterium]|nr:hypothetical protein [Alphaproteobacteria bacterium]